MLLKPIKLKYVSKIILSLGILGVLIFSAVACSNSYNPESFRDALIKADVGATLANIRISQTQVVYSKDNLELMASLDICTDEYAALNWFQGLYEGYENKAYGDIIQAKFDKDFSYFMIDGETKEDHLVFKYYYGGWYCKKDTVIIVYTTVDSDHNRSEVDRILKQLKYPLPKRTKTSVESESATTSTSQGTLSSISANATHNIESQTKQTTKVTENTTRAIQDIYPADIWLIGVPTVGNDSLGGPAASGCRDGILYPWSISSYSKDITLVWEFDNKTIWTDPVDRNRWMKINPQDFKSITLDLYVGVCNDCLNTNGKPGCIYIYSDDKLLYKDTNITLNTKTKQLSFDITGCKKLKIRLCSDGIYPGVFAPRLNIDDLSILGGRST